MESSRKIPLPLCSSCLYHVLAGQPFVCVCVSWAPDSQAPAQPEPHSTPWLLRAPGTVSATQSWEEIVEEWHLIIIKLILNLRIS